MREDCFATLVRAYLASPKFDGYEEATRRLWARYLRLAAEPDRLGAVSLQVIRPALVQAYIDGMVGKPGKQRATLRAIKRLEEWAIVRDTLPRTITTGVKAEESDGGHTPWTDYHVELVERHGREDMRRLATLGANTGQRGSDLVRMGWADIEVYKGIRGINVKQKKTGREVWIPITKHLADVMATWERQTGPFLRKMDGGFWTREQLHHAWVRHRDSNPELEPLSREGLVPHGLRGHACVRLLRFGANTRQISDWVGMSEGMVKNYTRFSDQKDNAVAAVFLLDGTQAERSSDKRRFGDA
jgi:integrase